MNQQAPRTTVAIFEPNRHQQYAVDAARLTIGHDATHKGFRLVDPSAIDASIDISFPGGGELEITNRGVAPILVNGRSLSSGQLRRTRDRSVLTIGNSSAAIVGWNATASFESVGSLQMLRRPQRDAPVNFQDHAWPSPSPQTLVRWFECLGDIQRLVTCTPEFYLAAVQAVVSPGGLDAGMYLVADMTGWQIQHSHVPSAPEGIQFDPRFVELAANSGQTVFHQSNPSDTAEPDAVFATPVYDGQNQVVGVLYGSRRRHEQNRRQGIRHLEALWIQLVAETVSSGIVRWEREREAARQRVLLEQAFPPQVIDQLQLSRNLELTPQEREITVMFADLMASSDIAHGLRPADAQALFADVLDMMTTAVHQSGGTIVDYYGDGLVAMWNAPVDQEDHAVRAVEAAQSMIRDRSELADHWESFLGRRLQIGVGIDTGVAIVGNSGSRRRLKYGPRGKCVNRASRLEKATRRLNTPLVISDATRRKLPRDLPVCRLGQFRLAGIDQPATLFAVAGVEGSDDKSSVTRYTKILHLMEKGDYRAASNLFNERDGSGFRALSYLERELTVIVPGSDADVAMDGDLVFDLRD